MQGRSLYLKSSATLKSLIWSVLPTYDTRHQTTYPSYLLIKSNGDNALVGANDAARKSRSGTLNARNDGADGGTLTARDGARDQSKHGKNLIVLQTWTMEQN